MMDLPQALWLFPFCEQFENAGVIGECPLREEAKLRYGKDTALTLSQTSFDVYRVIAQAYVSDLLAKEKS